MFVWQTSSMFKDGELDSAPSPLTVPPRLAAPVLTVDDLHVRFGGVADLSGARLSVREGEICGVIGPNGAGKTTLFNAITGLVPIDGGTVEFAGQRLDHRPAHQIARCGVSRTFQNLGLYLGMTVLENVLLGAHARFRHGFVGAALRLTSAAHDERRLRQRALLLLEQMGLADLASRIAGSLPFGTMKRVELARALIADPRLLLLDEPAGGLSHGEVEAFAALVRQIRRERRLTILLVEHHMKLVMDLCDHVVVLHLGKTLAGGDPDEIKRDPDVIAAYLGAAV